MVDGSRCYGCGGSGKSPVELTADLYQNLEQKVADGSLDRYLTELAERNRLELAARTAVDDVMKAWKESGVSELYSWMKAANGVEPDRTIADEVNDPINKAYKKVTEAQGSLESARFKLAKAKGTSEREALQAKVNEALAELFRIREESLEDVAKATEHLQHLKERFGLGKPEDENAPAGP